MSSTNAFVSASTSAAAMWVLEREKLTSDSHGARCLSERSFGSQADSQASFQSSSPFLEVGLEEIGRRRVVVVGCERVVRIEDGNLRNGFIILVIGFSKDLEEVCGDWRFEKVKDLAPAILLTSQARQ